MALNHRENNTTPLQNYSVAALANGFQARTSSSDCTREKLTQGSNRGVSNQLCRCKLHLIQCAIDFALLWVFLSFTIIMPVKLPWIFPWAPEISRVTWQLCIISSWMPVISSTDFLAGRGTIIWLSINMSGYHKLVLIKVSALRKINKIAL